MENLHWILPVISIAIIVLLIGRLVLRQLRWQPTGHRSFRLPVILGLVAVALLATELTALTRLSVVGWVVVGLQLVTAVVLGVVMGRNTGLRVGETGTPESRGGVLGAVLLIGLIAARYGEAAIGQQFGAGPIGQLTGLALLMVALNRLTAALLVNRRADELRTPEYA